MLENIAEGTEQIFIGDRYPCLEPQFIVAYAGVYASASAHARRVRVALLWPQQESEEWQWHSPSEISQQNLNLSSAGFDLGGVQVGNCQSEAG